MFTKLKQFKEMRDKAKQLQGALSTESVTSNAAGNKIVMTLDGNLNMTALVIDDELLSPDKKDKLTSGIKEAYADAMKKIQRIMAMKMKDMGGIPGLN